MKRAQLRKKLQTLPAPAQALLSLLLIPVAMLLVVPGVIFFFAAMLWDALMDVL